jgi:hypothetical protein
MMDWWKKVVFLSPLIAQVCFFFVSLSMVGIMFTEIEVALEGKLVPERLIL